jgi:TPR repeat protein
MNRLMDDGALMQQEQNLDELRKAHALLSSNRSKGLVDLEALANNGSVLAMLYLANAYISQKPPVYSLAEKLFRGAYERNSSRALFSLGVLYSKIGKYDEAERLFLEGNSEGDGPSMYGLARLYLSNIYFKNKRGEAKYLLENAIKCGQVRAKIRLSYLFLSGAYGVFNIPRGLWLFFTGIPETVGVAYRDPHSQRLW